MFRLSASPIETLVLDAPAAGGFVTFEGKVRDHAEGRRVLQLEYEAYPEMAISQGEALVSDAIAKYGLTAATVIHRVGLLHVGETAVVIQVAAPHRREAFAASEWIIDELKIRVPIWKRETFEGGDSAWVGADVQIPNDDPSGEFYRRQIALPEIGETGQAKLRSASVLLVGVGGLGCGCLPALVGSGIGRIGLVDPDDVDRTNLHRQPLFRDDEVGRSKSERAAAFAMRLNPNIRVEAYAARLEGCSAETLVSSYDWIVDGTDSLETKFLLNATCKKLGKPLVTASIHKFEGQLLTVVPDGPCLNCLFDAPPPDGCVDTCAQTGVLGVLPGVFGQLLANEVLKGILGYGETLRDDLWLFDLRTLESTRLRRVNRDGCKGCQGILERDPVNITFKEAQELLGEFEVVDLRSIEATELPFPARRATASTLDPNTTSKPLLLCCDRGVTSLELALKLRSEGKANVYSLKGGAASLFR